MSSVRAHHESNVYEGFGRPEMLPFIPAGARSILDVGCNAGNFGALLKAKREIEVWGVEVDAGAADVASKRLDRVLCAPFDNNLRLERKFDCIVFNDVLEHMVDPYSALELARSLLEPGGKVVASIPNVRYFGNLWELLVRRSWEYQETGILDRTHLRFFTKKTSISMFENLGFRVENITGINTLGTCDPHLYRIFYALNLLTFGHIEDTFWLQFAIVGVPE